ncbi:CPBP family intramembrane glutamic endopeptidase [Rhodohalobacter mucosus]|uniref:CPBP family intramembrane metalloprotease domain-containing protein n=1 Tax=Rhodohalobacter mucosus TaxID=2079485 RepID=A0A316U3T7_9BACT|nr:CPBP family intramembrane glutamic endopeptidase [Rhodohalobacter mucosus]PWN08156.1 CPBP family intramembrane metalloprotease domain-containing protein [Rhodohalobacter mucosus]
MMNQFEEPSSMDSVRSWAEKNGFADWAIAGIWLVLAWVLFQAIAGFVLVGLLLVSGDLQSVDTSDVQTLLMSRLDLLFIGNSTGQILIIGLATFLIVRLHLGNEQSGHFLRLSWTEKTPLYLGLGSLLIVAIQPAIIYLGYLNSLIPMPESMLDMQISQYEIIEKFLTQEGILLFGLFNVAVVPAFCEEIMFRGYIMRALERSWGIIAGIVVSGFLFGMFHLQLPNLFPLAMIGVVLALMTWLSGSIWPAVLAHFINNGAAVLLGSTYPELAFAEMSAESLPPIWSLVISIILSVVLIRYMLRMSTEKSG